MLVKQGKEYALVDLPKDKLDTKEGKLKLLNGLDMALDRHAEWTQIYNEAWRQMRDFFYAPNMNGVDWKAMHDKYAALLPFVNSRNDLTYLIGELIAELNNGHAYVGGGERPEDSAHQARLAGRGILARPRNARLSDRPHPAGRELERRHPLAVDRHRPQRRAEGDYLLAINGKPVAKLANLYEALIDTAGKQVTLRAQLQADRRRRARHHGGPNRRTRHRSTTSPGCRKNIDYVAKKTGGKVGYLHIPDMGKPGLNEFTKLYFPQIQKQGLIVDVRGNGGGFVSPLVIERLRRALVMVEMSRNNSVPQTNPPQTFIGPMDALMDEFSASDGDIFPFRFKTLKPWENSSANARGAASSGSMRRCRSWTAGSSSSRSSRRIPRTARAG